MPSSPSTLYCDGWVCAVKARTCSMPERLPAVHVDMGKLVLSVMITRNWCRFGSFTLHSPREPSRDIRSLCVAHSLLLLICLSVIVVDIIRSLQIHNC
jgi:cytochrome b561